MSWRTEPTQFLVELTGEFDPGERLSDPNEDAVTHYLYVGASRGQDIIENVLTEAAGSRLGLLNALKSLEDRVLIRIMRLGPVDTWSQNKYYNPARRL